MRKSEKIIDLNPQDTTRLSVAIKEFVRFDNHLLALNAAADQVIETGGSARLDAIDRQEIEKVTQDLHQKLNDLIGIRSEKPEDVLRKLHLYCYLSCCDDPQNESLPVVDRLVASAAQDLEAALKNCNQNYKAASQTKINR